MVKRPVAARSEGLVMRRSVILTSVLTLAAAGVTPALAAQTAGQGAQKSGLSPQAGSTTSQCEQGTGTQTNGFAILNTAGQVGAAVLTNGEVALKRATPDTTYTVRIAQNGMCLPITSSLTTNAVGNGNAHLRTTPALAGTTYYVVVQDSSGNEVFASGPVTLA